MLDFMIIALPRSGTTWASVWLDAQHDPLYKQHYTEWAGRISCTGIWRWPDWVNAQSCPKVILHRPLAAIWRSLEAAGVSPREVVDLGDDERLNALQGLHLPWTDLWDDPERICGHLGVPFDGARHRALSEIRMEPRFGDVSMDVALQHRLARELGIHR